ncbi:Crp/Fnr family transcriptional regulator [Ruminococcaceae bacterium OttesenSCG-928-I18]|nr:Crp/Fnr family transcriptional regulator [Ruminococcaceae bacterium OttesenSCG-928-I18]
MDNHILPILRQCPLFRQIEPGDIPSMLQCLSAVKKGYRKGETVFSAGSAITHVGIVLTGRVHVEQNDYWGNRTILTQVGPAELFGEAFSCAGIEKLPVNVYAAEPSEILLIDYRKIIRSCSSACPFHAKLIQNMLWILAQKNVALTQKMETLTQRTTRDKLLAYLSRQAQAQGSSQFEIPFSRQELADYLSVDRSAMSSELSKMQKEGLLQFQKNRFSLL